MFRKIATVAVLSTTIGFVSVTAARGQSVSPYTTQVNAPLNYNSPLYNSAVYNATGNAAPMYTTPSVSPYLNLGFNQNGLSNYQTLVKPMIDEQDGLQRQAANLQKLQRQVRDAPKSGGRDSGRSQPTARFFNYSHYYGGSGGGR